MPETWRSQRYQRNHSGVVRKFKVADLLDLLEQTRSQLVPNWPASFFHEILDLQPRSRTKRGNHSGIHCCLYVYTHTYIYSYRYMCVYIYVQVYIHIHHTFFQVLEGNDFDHDGVVATAVAQDIHAGRAPPATLLSARTVAFHPARPGRGEPRTTRCTLKS